MIIKKNKSNRVERGDFVIIPELNFSDVQLKDHKFVSDISVSKDTHCVWVVEKCNDCVRFGSDGIHRPKQYSLIRRCDEEVLGWIETKRLKIVSKK